MSFCCAEGRLHGPDGETLGLFLPSTIRTGMWLRLHVEERRWCDVNSVARSGARHGDLMWRFPIVGLLSDWRRTQGPFGDLALKLALFRQFWWFTQNPVWRHCQHFSLYHRCRVTYLLPHSSAAAGKPRPGKKLPARRHGLPASPTWPFSVPYYRPFTNTLVDHRESVTRQVLLKKSTFKKFYVKTAVAKIVITGQQDRKIRAITVNSRKFEVNFFTWNQDQESSWPLVIMFHSE